jgi:chemotaxis protein MotB
MARRKHHEEHANHEAWAIPYADLMTLLLAFFVVMYAISSLNEGKYRVMADSLSTAFGGAPRTISQVQVGNMQIQGGGHDTPSVIRSPSMTGGAMADPTQLPSMASHMRMPVSTRNQEQLQRAERQLNQIADRLSSALAPLVKQGVITVRRTELWLEVEINSDILFATGSAPRSSRPTGSCPPVARPASCTCSPTMACSRHGWRWWAMASSARAKATTCRKAATATGG